MKINKNSKSILIASKLTISTVVIIFMLIIIEFYLSMSGYKKIPYRWSWSYDGKIYELNSKRIYSFVKSSPKDNLVIKNINKNGFRTNPDDSNIMKNPGIFLFGDSFTFGHGMKNDETFPFHAQKLLNSHFQKFNIINAGVPGYGFDQAYLYILEVISIYSPKYIVWNLNINDIIDTNDVCLFKEIFPNKFIQLPVWSQTLYLQGVLVRRMPKMISSSNLANLVLNCLQHNRDRFTLGCSVDYNNKELMLQTGLSRLNYFIDQLSNISEKKDIRVIYTLVPTQVFFEPILFPDKSFEMKSYYGIISTLRKKKVTFVDANKLIAELYFPDILMSRGVEQVNNNSKSLALKKILGTGTLEKEKLFLLNESELIQHRHISIEGNKFLGKLFAEELINILK